MSHSVLALSMVSLERGLFTCGTMFFFVLFLFWYVF